MKKHVKLILKDSVSLDLENNKHKIGNLRIWVPHNVPYVLFIIKTNDTK